MKFLEPHPTADASPKNRPTRLGLVGIAGYAGYLGQRLADAMADPANPRLAAMFVPDPQNHAPRIDQLREMGVAFHDTYERLLDDDLDALWLPVPIHLHRTMPQAALARGIAVMCEKPVAATVDDVLAMRDAQRRANVPVYIGFQDIYEPATLQLKHALLDARPGKPLRAVVTGGWPRGSDYYRRNDWAGKLRHRDDWVLDGPAHNAMAHFINLAAFLLGTTPQASATPTSIEAELYRANDIDSYDTFSARVGFAAGSVLTALLTHACDRETEPTVQVLGDRLHATWRNQHDAIDLRVDGRDRPIPRDVDGRDAMIRVLAGQQTGGPIATLDTSLAHTVIVNGAVEASRIHRIPPAACRRTFMPDKGHVLAARGVDTALQRVAHEHKLLSELGLFDWTQPHAPRNLRNYRRFKGPKPAANKPKPTVVVNTPQVLPPKRRTTTVG